MFMATSLPEIRAHRGRPKKWYCGPIKDSDVLRQATHTVGLIKPRRS